MLNGLKISQNVGHLLMRAGQRLAIPVSQRVYPMEHQLMFRNPFIAQLVRKGRVIATTGGHNGVTIVGKNHMLDVVFGAASPVTQIDPWYIGLINQSPTPTLAEADTLSSHSGWSEFTSYSGNRQAWTDADASAKVKGTTTVSTFTISATGDVHGIFVCSVATGTSGVLWATGSFDASLPVVSADELKITYGVRL